MCTGPDAARCPNEILAWRLYEEHGYRPRSLRSCLTVRPPAQAARRRGLLARLRRRGT